MNPINHIAIIMDGNGRWGLKYKNSRNAGHKAGLNTVEKIIKETIKKKIKYLTLYAFSTENWKRPKKEVKFLFSLLENFLKNKIEDLNKQKIRLKIIGKKNFSSKLNNLLKISEKITLKNKRLQINLALNYGSKGELIYAFSTENWKRPKNEINYLFSLLNNFLSNKIKELNNQKIKFYVIGKKKFNKKLNKLLNYSEKLTSRNKKLQINLALNYGSKSEIVNSLNSIKKKKIEINEKNIEKNLYTRNIPDPDILIRTGNTKRLSNFLLWQLAYSEIYFEKKLWPDFNEKDYNKILNKFKKVKRNFGKI